MSPARGSPRAVDSPLVSVIVATPRPGEAIARAVRSVLANEGPPFEVRIVSPTAPPSHLEDPSSSLGNLLGDRRVHWTRTAETVSANAHNVAIADAPGEIVAITDEDCEVASNWVAEIAHAFDRDDRIGVVFGALEPARRDDPSTPAYPIEREFLARRPTDKPRVEGIWACMAVRRRTWEALGGFDARFGRGARFPGCADADLTIRALASRHHVLETPRVRVRSHRSLSPEEHRRSVEGYTYASGALIGTHLRARTPGAFRMAAGLVRRRAGRVGHGALGAGADRPHKRLGTFLRGVVDGALAPSRSIR